LRGSAGFSPASLSSPSGKDARSERNDKEQKEQNDRKQRPQESNGCPCRSQIWVALDKNEGAVKDKNILGGAGHRFFAREG
jgi:hypothetical protein